MGNLSRRVILALLCLAPLVRPVPASAGDQPRFTGTFIQLLAGHAAWDRPRWQGLFAALRSVGVAEVVVQWTVADGVPTYPSAHFKAAPHLALPTMLEAAREAGLRVVLGLVHDSAFWSKIDRDPKLVRVYFRRLLMDSLAAGREIAAMGKGNPAFAGFYIPQEIDDRTWLDPAKGKVLEEFLADLAAGLRAIAPGAAVAVSGFSNGFAEPETLCRFWERLLTTTGIDRVAFQDGVGVAKLRPGEAGVFLQAVSRAAVAAGRTFTPVVETFTQTDGPPMSDRPFRAEPAPLQRILLQLDVAGRAPHDGVWAFSLPEYCSPYGGEAAAALFAAYKSAISR